MLAGNCVPLRVRAGEAPFGGRTVESQTMPHDADWFQGRWTPASVQRAAAENRQAEWSKLVARILARRSPTVSQLEVERFRRLPGPRAVDAALLVSTVASLPPGLCLHLMDVVAQSPVKAQREWMLRTTRYDNFTRQAALLCLPRLIAGHPDLRRQALARAADMCHGGPPELFGQAEACLAPTARDREVLGLQMQKQFDNYEHATSRQEELVTHLLPRLSGKPEYLPALAGLLGAIKQMPRQTVHDVVATMFETDPQSAPKYLRRQFATVLAAERRNTAFFSNLVSACASRPEVLPSATAVFAQIAAGCGVSWYRVLLRILRLRHHPKAKTLPTTPPASPVPRTALPGAGR